MELLSPPAPAPALAARRRPPSRPVTVSDQDDVQMARELVRDLGLAGWIVTMRHFHNKKVCVLVRDGASFVSDPCATELDAAIQAAATTLKQHPVTQGLPTLLRWTHSPIAAASACA